MAVERNCSSDCQKNYQEEPLNTLLILFRYTKCSVLPNKAEIWFQNSTEDFFNLLRQQKRMRSFYGQNSVAQNHSFIWKNLRNKTGEIEYPAGYMKSYNCLRFFQISRKTTFFRRILKSSNIKF